MPKLTEKRYATHPCLFALLGVALAGRSLPAAEPATGQGPKLAVVIVIDQFRGDYLERWQQFFGKDGFKRITTEGAWFQNCHYPYAATMTGPGHASISTGASPYKHGIIMNDWYDRGTGKMVNCVENNRFQRLPPKSAAEIKEETKPAEKTETKEKASDDDKPYAVAPDRLLSPTLADALKEQSGGKARVVSLSYKDRGAALPGGQKPDVCLWFNENTAGVISSTYYQSFTPWAITFNQNSHPERWFKESWLRQLEKVDYTKFSSADDTKGEGSGEKQGRTFPHSMTGGGETPKKGYYKAVYRSPFGNELLLELALKAIDEEQLGTHETADLLCISFSSNDVVGHVWGPDSQEVMDMTVRTDDVMRRLLEHLDKKVGKGRYVLALSADHGVCPLPEATLAQSQKAGRVNTKTLDTELEKMLKAKFEPDGKTTWLEKGYYPWVWLNQKAIKSRNLKPADVEQAVADWIKKQPGIQAAYTRTQLSQGISPSDTVGTSVWRAFHPARSGDVYVVLRPNFLFGTGTSGTSHGTPHTYDTHVPLLVYGTNVKPGIHKELVTPQAIAPIMAQALGIKPPRDAEYAVPAGVFMLVK